MEKQLENAMKAIGRWKENDKENRAIIVLAMETNTHPDGRVVVETQHGGYRNYLITALAGMIMDNNDFREMMLEAVIRYDSGMVSTEPPTWPKHLLN